MRAHHVSQSEFVELSIRHINHLEKDIQARRTISLILLDEFQSLISRHAIVSNINRAQVGHARHPTFDELQIILNALEGVFDFLIPITIEWDSLHHITLPIQFATNQLRLGTRVPRNKTSETNRAIANPL